MSTNREHNHSVAETPPPDPEFEEVTLPKRGNIAVVNELTTESEAVNEDPEEFTADDWKRLRQKECARFSDLFSSAVKDLEQGAQVLYQESARRIKRYQRTRIGVVFAMIVGLILTIFVGGTLALEIILTKMVTLFIGAALLLYVIEAFLRDYEVGLRSTTEADRLSSIARKARFDWTLSNASEDEMEARKILESIKGVDMGVNTLITAEKVIPISEMSGVLRGQVSTTEPLGDSRSPRSPDLRK